MMFEQNFMPEGAEINPDTPRKKGLARLFEILSRIWTAFSCPGHWRC